MDIIKFIIVGETQVGKTSIINQYIENQFSEEYVTTITQDKSTKEIELGNNTKIKIEIWDTVGQKGFRGTNKIFMKNTKIALLVYDITDQKSFDELNELYEQVNEVNGKGKVYFVVAGNKSDLYEDQVVSKETGEEYAKSINALFYETTATDHECIENLFKESVTEYVKHIVKSNDDNTKKDEKQNDSKEQIDNQPVDNKVPNSKQIENALKNISDVNPTETFTLNNEKKKNNGCC